MKPQDIDTSKPFQNSKWQKAELEWVARKAVQFCQRAGKWTWFRIGDLDLDKDEVPWLNDMCQTGFLFKNYTDSLITYTYYPTDKFFEYIEPYKHAN